MKLRLINQQVVDQCLTMEKTIELMELGYRELSAERVDVPLRTALVNDKGVVLYKPAYSDAAQIFCAKVVSVFKGNVDLGLPVTPGVIIVNNASTGMPEAILEAGYLTALRTGAATGVGTKVFSNQSVTTAALFGTGGQAFHQLEAMLCVRDFKIVYVFSRNQENAVTFCEKNQAMAGECQLIPNPERSVLKDCEVITCATSCPTPVFEDHEISDSVHINAIGSLGPKNTEVPMETMLRAHVCVDQRAACMAEAGEICVLRDAGLLPEGFHADEIGELLEAPEKIDRSRVSVFKSVGNAIQDLLCSAEILRQADAKGLGMEAEL